MKQSDQLCVPYVAGIIERTDKNGRKQFLIQTRHIADYPSIYNGTFEFVAGTLDQPYENIYEALSREILEETGMKLKAIIDDSKTKIINLQGKDAAFGFRPFCCTQQLKDGRPWIGFVFRCEVEEGKPRERTGESKDVHWMDEADFRHIYETSPERIFTLELPAWEYYFQSQA